MKRILAIGIILLFIGMSISSSTGFNAIEQSIKPLNGKTLYVGGSGPNNYTKIQDAINDSSDGDTVFVYDDSSPYKEYLIGIEKSINLIGEDRETTIIDGKGISHGAIIIISHDYVNISGFSIVNAGEWYGISITKSSSYITISDCIINVNGGGNGTFLGLYTNYTVIQNCIYKNAFLAIWNLGYGSNNKYINNTIMNSFYGIYLVYCNKSLVCNNNIRNNYRGIRIIGNDNLIYHNNFINNTHNAFDNGNNTWDFGYPWGGNYWDNYTGNDSDGDGIGDTPYPIPGGDNEDRYPLMKPWNGSYNRPYGPSKGLVGVDYTFCYDLPYNPDGDPYIVMWYWGDGDSSEWLGPYEPGETVCANHKWGKPGDYGILVITRDVHGFTYWSEPWTITVVNITNLVVDIQVKFPGKISAHIRNVGNETAIDVNYSITVKVKGILFGIGTIFQNGTFDKLPPESEHIWTISQGLIIGLGRFHIIVTASAFNAKEVIKELNAFVFLFFIKIISGGNI